MPVLVRISATDTTVESDAASDEAAQAQFAARQAIVLDDLLDPDLQAKLAAHWRSAHFRQDDVGKLGSRLLETPPRAGNMIGFVLQRAALHRWLEKITGLPAIAGVTGDVARLAAGQDHHLDWHNDAGGKGRVLGVTINLGSEPYEGGHFELQRRGSDEILLRHDHHRPGSALVFRVEKDLLHRVLPVTAGGPRTVFSGWFLSPPVAPN